MRKIFSWKAAILIGCFVSLMVILAGCGKAVKNETEIKVDLQNHAGFYSEQDVVIQKLSIIKRQTNEKEKTDTVYVDADVSNDAVKGQLSYVLNYNLYDEGWILDNVSRYFEGEWNFTPLKGPEQGAADTAIKEKVSVPHFDKREDFLEQNLSRFYYSSDGRHYYKSHLCRYIAVYVADFSFNTETGLWEFNGVTRDTDTYYCYNCNGQINPDFDTQCRTCGESLAAEVQEKYWSK